MGSSAGDLFFALLISSLLLHTGAEARLLTKEEDLEIEQQLQRLNKPAIKTIQTEDGDVYDCVDFYKQPAFDHPLLKNHTFHFRMKPSSQPRRARKEDTSDAGEISSLNPKRLDCPYGTVPIRRVTKEDLVMAKSLNSPIYGSGYQPFTAEKSGLHVALGRTKSIPGKTYNGGGANISVEMPHANTSQYSSARMEIRNGPDAIQVGWTVNPSLYKDDRTRGFISLKTATSSCFNTFCPGFILVTEQYPIDGLIQPISKVGGPNYVYEVFIYRDGINGNWWLELGTTHIQVGFWPERIFTGLKGPADYVDWGGEVYSPPDVPSPPMGRGYFLDVFDKGHDAFFMHVTTIDEAHQVVEARDTEGYCDNKQYYQVKDDKHIKHFGHVVFYGGPGGATGPVDE